MKKSWTDARLLRWLIGILVLCTVVPVLVNAHSLRTAYLEIAEGLDNTAYVVWKVSVTDNILRPEFPKDCDVKQGTSPEGTPGTEFHLKCRTPLAGKEISVSGMGVLTTETIVRMVSRNGESFSKVLSPGSPRWVIPSHPSNLQVGLDFVGLGIGHIFSGIDHLLFLLGLILLVKAPRQIILTATAFTVAHSLTLTITVLDWVRVSSQAAEACIALSLVFVAFDLLRKDVKHQARRGPMVAFGFGLVHGMGFAAGLTEIGLPKEALPLSLFSFNLGVEIGQVCFIVLVFAVLKVARNILKLREKTLEWVVSYAILIPGTFMLIDRLQPLFDRLRIAFEVP
jgi:hypothetical protein